MSTWKIFKKILTKKKDQAISQDRERIDTDLPLGFRLGGLVSLEQADFIIHRDKLNFDNPGKDHVVKAWGSFELFGVKFHRFYCLGKENEEQSIIQVSEVDGKPEDVRLFRNFEEVTPQDDTEWEDWLGKNGHIGQGEFGWDDEDGTPVDFVRVWDSDLQGRTNPAHFVETIHTDPYGEDPLQMVSDTMLYSRPLDEEKAEYLMITAEQTEEEACVRLIVGLDIGHNDIEVV